MSASANTVELIRVEKIDWRQKLYLQKKRIPVAETTLIVVPQRGCDSQPKAKNQDLNEWRRRLFAAERLLAPCSISKVRSANHVRNAGRNLCRHLNQCLRH
jgi:hypothetical protein